jgi:hypothetical protein
LLKVIFPQNLSFDLSTGLRVRLRGRRGGRRGEEERGDVERK